MEAQPARRTAGLVMVLIPFVVLAAGFVYEFQSIRALSGGRFVYSMDDPYIHLALAESIADGHYGINPGEPSAPSSSIVWPFLLAPFAPTPFFEYVPLAINTLCAALTLVIYTRIGRMVFHPARGPGYGEPAFPVMVTTLLLIPTTNLIGLAFTGMEHSLQVLVSAGIVYGLAVLVLEGRFSPWLAAAAAAAPLVRFECLAVSLPALGVMALYRRSRRAAVLSAVGMGLGLGAFALFLHGQGLGLLPTSVMAKSAHFANATPLETVLAGLRLNLSKHQGKVLALVWVGLLVGGGRGAKAAALRGSSRLKPAVQRRLGLAAGFSRLGQRRPGIDARAGRRETRGPGIVARTVAPKQPPRLNDSRTLKPGMLLPLFALIVLTLHLVFGQVGWWDRYEVYVVTAVVLVGLLAARERLCRVFAAAPARGVGVLFLVSLAVGVPYYINFAQTPLAASNIYEQQYQMHRFVVELYRAPVAVNDLGWVSYRSPYYVLDLWGLASQEALEQRLNNSDPAWMDRLARARGVRLVMIYDTWLTSHPEGWQAVGLLHLGRPQLATGSSVVTFYALDDETARRMRALLEEFRATLPEGVGLEIYQ